MTSARPTARLLLACLAGAGCAAEASGELRASTTVRAAPGEDEAAASSPDELEARFSPGADAEALEVECDADASEQCNAIDDDCDGTIDEGCGYGSGPIQVTLAWDTGADLDLHVTDPLGETISNTHRRSGTGGRMDRDGRGRCRPGTELNVENVFWEVEQPLGGTYRVQVHYWGECNSSAGPTEATVSIAVGDRARAFRYVVTPGERVTVATFEIP